MKEVASNKTMNLVLGIEICGEVCISNAFELRFIAIAMSIDFFSSCPLYQHFSFSNKDEQLCNKCQKLLL